jgi:hypothetical protein
MEMERPREKLVRGTGSLSAAQCLWLHIVVSGTMAVWNPETKRSELKRCNRSQSSRIGATCILLTSLNSELTNPWAWWQNEFCCYLSNS